LPRRDCSARRGCRHARNRAGCDHHAARRGAQEEQDVARERTLEAAPRLDGRAHDEKLGPVLGRDARDVLAEAPRPRAHDLPPHADAVRERDGSGRLELLVQLEEPAVHVRVQRELALDHERRDENDARAPIGGETAREIERVLGLLPVEERHDDAAIGDRARPAREAARAPVERSEVGKLHRMSW